MEKFDFIFNAMSEEDKKNIIDLSNVILKKLKDGKADLESQIENKNNELIDLSKKLEVIQTKIEEWKKVSNKKDI